MERLLLGTAHMLAWARKKRTAGGGLEEFLGEFLDSVYKRSGVLIDAPPAGGGGGAAAVTPGPASAAGAAGSTAAVWGGGGSEPGSGDGGWSAGKKG